MAWHGGDAVFGQLVSKRHDVLCLLCIVSREKPILPVVHLSSGTTHSSPEHKHALCLAISNPDAPKSRNGFRVYQYIRDHHRTLPQQQWLTPPQISDLSDSTCYAARSSLLGPVSWDGPTLPAEPQLNHGVITRYNMS